MLAALLASIAFVTAVLSGIFGMAGGMVLMGAYTALLPVATAMVMHGGTQMLSNASRAYLLWRDVYWRGLWFYMLGASLAFGAVSSVRYVPERAVVFLVLGLTPFVAALLPKHVLDFQRPAAATWVGAQVAAVQLLAGAAGPLLDVAFLDTQLTRTQIVATKAVTQVFSHSLKIAYFLPLLPHNAITLPVALAVLCTTVLGTYVGTRILHTLSDQRFKLYSRYIVYGTGVYYLYQAARLW